MSKKVNMKNKNCTMENRGFKITKLRREKKIHLSKKMARYVTN